MTAPPLPSPAPQATLPPLVGMFDSGVGGLSVLRVMQASMPHASFIYVADSAYAPYGERSDAFVIERSLSIVRYLVAQGAGLLVVACNTATAAAAAVLRAQWPHLPLVGMEPAIKPAVRASVLGRIGVMATPTTLRSDKFQRLLETHRGDAIVHVQACPGLAGLIEQGDLKAPALVQLIENFCQPLKEAGVDTVVLGCTHYVFVRDQIQATMGPGVQLIDTAAAVARQALRLLPCPAPPPAPTSVRLKTTGDVAHIARLAQHSLGLACDLSSSRLDPGVPGDLFLPSQE